MSVPKSKRSKSKLEVLIKARDLVKYSLTVTGNEKIFTPNYKALIEDINHTSERIFIDAFMANNINNKIQAGKEKRIELQTKAILECNNLLALIELAYSIFHLRAKRVEFWTSLIIEEKKLIQCWRSAEKDIQKS